MSKSPRGFPRPLSELLSATLGDVLKAQGFASTEIISRWPDIVGLEIAAHSEPLKINWPRPVGGETPEPATLVLRVEGPAALEIQHLAAVILERVNRFFGWQAIGRIALRQAPLRRREKPRRKCPILKWRRRSPKPCRILMTKISVRRLPGWARRSSKIEATARLGRLARHCHNCAVQLASDGLDRHFSPRSLRCRSPDANFA